MTPILKFTFYTLIIYCIVLLNDRVNLKLLSISLLIAFFSSILNEILTEIKKLNNKNGKEN